MSDSGLQKTDVQDKAFRTDGHCLCERISYMLKSSDESPPYNLICHCPSCRRISGTAFATNVIISKKDMVWRESAPDTLKLYLDHNTESGLPMRRWFCSNCGNPVFATTPVWDDVVSVFAGTLVDQQSWKPTEEIFMDTKAPWLPDFGTETKHARGPPT